MIALCQLCGQVIAAREVVSVLSVPEAQRMERDLQNLDLLAGTMSRHVGEFHADESDQMTAAAFLVSKMYAMQFIESTAQNFETLRKAWTTAIAVTLFPAAIWEPTELLTAARQAAGNSVSVSSAPPAES